MCYLGKRSNYSPEKAAGCGQEEEKLRIRFDFILEFILIFLVCKREEGLLIGLLYVPHKFLTSRNSEWDFPWKLSLCKCSQVNMRSLRWVPIQNDWCLYKKGKFGHRETWAKERHEETQREQIPCENGGLGDKPASQGMPRITENHQKLGRGKEVYFLQVSKGAQSSIIFISDFQPPELCDNTFYCPKSPSWWYFVTAALGS